MKKDTTIISYSDYREQNSPPSSQPVPQNGVLIEMEANETLDPKAGIELELTQRVPLLFSLWKKSMLFTLKRRSLYIKQNLFHDFFRGATFKYPFNGLLIITTHSVYWGQLLIFAGCYLTIFITIGVIYYVVLVPTILAWAIVTLGPLGAVIVHIQWLLQTNALTALVCRNIILTHINNQIFDITLYLYGQREFLRSAKYIKVTPKEGPQLDWTMLEFWIISVPMWITSNIRKLLILVVLASISVIPLVGPTVANQLISGRRAFSYMGRYFTLKGISRAKAKDFEYEHLGLFLSFGMAAGLLEIIPLFSIITITSNTVGAAKWSIDLMKNP